MSEYQRRLNAYARDVAATKLPDWSPPDDAVAEWQVFEAWPGTDVTPGSDGSLSLLLGGQWVQDFMLSDVPDILRALFEVDAP